MMNVTSVKRIHQSDWTDSGVRFLRARDIVAAAKNEEPDDYLYISKEKYEEYSALSGKVGVSDLLVTGVGTIGVPYLVRNLEPLYFKDGNIIWFQNSDKIDGKFLFYSFSAEQIQGFINESAGIGTVGTYTIESGKKTPISLPNQIEQAKVGEFFQQLDNLITLHQRQPFLHSPPDISLIVQLTPPFYTFSWEQRKLSEITDKVTEKNAGLQYVETFTNSAEFGIISQRDFFDHDIAKLGSLDGYYIVKNEDFVYNPRISTSAPVGPINRNKLGRTGVMSPLYTVFRPHDIDTTYLEYFFKCGYWHSFMNFNGDSGARSDRFSIRDNVFFQMPIPIPDIDEQRKIGELLTCLDNLITLHQRKFEKLTNVKKSMLEKMFPQNGSSYPEIRFKGFTDPWEQRKWINTVDISTNMVDPKSGKYDLLPHVAPGNIESFTGRLYDNVKLVGEENLISGKFVFNVGDIVYGKINPQLGKYVFARFSGLTSADAYVLNAKNGIVQKFLYAVIQTRDFYDYSVSVSKRSGMPKINRDELNAYSYWAPSESEQLKIGEYLLTLDHLITLHQRELEKLQNIKKSMLEKMFV